MCTYRERERKVCVCVRYNVSFTTIYLDKTREDFPVGRLSVTHRLSIRLTKLYIRVSCSVGIIFTRNKSRCTVSKIHNVVSRGRH